MKNGYRAKLFASYHSTHLHYLDSEDDTEKLKWFRQYVRLNYLPWLEGYPRETVKVLEIGCNKGYLLSALTSFGFTLLHGIDLSRADVEIARKLVRNATIECVDAADYLKTKGGQFDVVILKAVLEHVAKDDIIPFLKMIKDATKPDALVIVDVPNMDWLMAPHERYMDFTHEIGFTRESLAQVMRNVFLTVAVVKGKSVAGQGFKGKIGAIVRPVVIRAMNLVFRVIGEGMSDVWWDCRSIIAIVKV